MDIDFLLFLQSFREKSAGLFDGFFLKVTSLGESSIIILVIAGIFWCINKRAGTFLILASALGALFSQFFKILFCVYRPWVSCPDLHPVPEALKKATGFSFPSGHTISATSIWGGLAVILRDNAKIKWCFIILAVLIGFSRNYLGVHTPQDVLAGFLLGGLILVIVYQIMARLDVCPAGDKYVLAGGILCAGAVVAFAWLREIPDCVDAEGKLLVSAAYIFGGTLNSMGFTVGTLCGWFVERRWVCLDEKCGSWQEKLFRFLLGVTLLMIFSSLLPLCFAWLPQSPGAMCERIMTGFFITCLYPWIAKKISPSAHSKKKAKMGADCSCMSR